MNSLESSPVFTGDAIEDSHGRDAFFQHSKLPEELTQFLAEMDRKVDRILGLLSQDHIRSDFPLDIEIMELSAAGIRFRTKEKIPTDAPLEVVLLLSYAPLRMAGSKGRVLAVDADTGLYRFEFVDTRAADMEAIVQFVFREQREQIRNAKM